MAERERGGENLIYSVLCATCDSFDKLYLTHQRAVALKMNLITPLKMIEAESFFDAVFDYVKISGEELDEIALSNQHFYGFDTEGNIYSST